jgi:hypothetical protein
MVSINCLILSQIRKTMVQIDCFLTIVQFDCVNALIKQLQQNLLQQAVISYMSHAYQSFTHHCYHLIQNHHSPPYQLSRRTRPTVFISVRVVLILVLCYPPSASSQVKEQHSLRPDTSAT